MAGSLSWSCFQWSVIFDLSVWRLCAGAQGRLCRKLRLRFVPKVKYCSSHQACQKRQWRHPDSSMPSTVSPPFLRSLHHWKKQEVIFVSIFNQGNDLGRFFARMKAKFNHIVLLQLTLQTQKQLLRTAWSSLRQSTDSTAGRCVS